MADLRRQSAVGKIKAVANDYGDDIGGWIKQLASRYAIGSALLIVALMLVIAAVGVGAAALLHWLSMEFSVYWAFAILGGSLLLAAALFAVIGVGMIEQPIKPLPSPSRHLQSARLAVTTPLATKVAALTRPADETTQLVAVASGVLLVGWAFASFVSRRRDG